MKSEPTLREALLIELVYELSKGNPEQMGYSLEEIIVFLRTPIRKKEGLNAFECLDLEGRKFIDDLIKYLNDN